MPRNGMLIRISLALGAAAVLATIAVSAAGAARQSNPTLTGAGSTFVQPLISTWTQLPSPSESPFTSAKNINVTYGGGGSGVGVSDITNHQVDFGASDAPLTAFNPTCDTCYQIPWALSGTALIYRIDGLSVKLKMSGPVLAQIYLGNIAYWDAASIKRLNKGVSIPHTAIITVHRDSASGTTYNLTDYLSHVSSTWKSQVGTSVSPSWPGSNTIAAHGSSGIDAAVKNNNGAVGYVDVYYGVNAHLDFMKIKNRAGNFISPTIASIAAASKIDTTPKADGTLSIVNPPSTMGYGKAYPISTYTYVDVQKQSAQAASLKTFLRWAVTTGQTYAKQDIFVPLPSGVVRWDKNHISKITQS
jgi:phosphate transport system substrate-binding protein